MKQTQILMGMPVTVEAADAAASEKTLAGVFDYFKYVDATFSTYKPDSEISLINRGKLGRNDYSEDMVEVLALSEKTKRETNGWFDIRKPDNSYDPSGLVKGWAVYNAAKILQKQGFSDFYVEAGGDIQVSGKTERGETWRVGIRNPFRPEEIIKVLALDNKGIATSGTYVRGQHIYNPKNPAQTDFGIVSLTVIGPNVYEADRFATAAFAMGKDGINFIEKRPGLEGYMIDKEGLATLTSNFENYAVKPDEIPS